MSMINDEQLLIGLLSISDRAAQGVYADQGIPALEEWFGRALASPWRSERRLIVDEQARIEETLKELVDELGCHLVLTTGGTGPAPRDVTPEATLAVADKADARLRRGNAPHQPELRADGHPFASDWVSFAARP
jgi:molybdopterin adenylyltransferase